MKLDTTFFTKNIVLSVACVVLIVSAFFMMDNLIRLMALSLVLTFFGFVVKSVATEPASKELAAQIKVSKGEQEQVELNELEETDFINVVVKNLERKLGFKDLFVKRNDITIKLFAHNEIVLKDTLSFVQNEDRAGGYYHGVIVWNSPQLDSLPKNQPLMLVVESPNYHVEVKVYVGVKALQSRTQLKSKNARFN